MKRIKKETLYGTVIGILSAELLGLLSNLASGAKFGAYRALRLPPAAPPGWVFPAVWTLLFAMIGASSYLVFERARDGRWFALGFFAAQLAVNFFWPVVFFRSASYGWATALAAVLFVLAAITAYLFFRAVPLAGKLFLPYVLWCAFAVYLTAGVLILNR